MVKKRHEEISRTSFSAWLKIQNLSNKAVWTEVEQKDEPPDWYLDIGVNRLAIEATSVVDYLWEFDPPLPSFSVSASLVHLIDRVESIAKSKGPLNGAYLVSLAPIPNLRDNENWLIDELVSYVDRTRYQDSAEEYELGKLRSHTLSIVKFKSDREYVAEAISFEAKFEGQASEDLKEVLTMVFQKKEHSLREIEIPIVLLLLDAFKYSHIADWLDVISDIDIPSIFSYIFRTQVDAPAQLLHSQGSLWQI